MHAVVPGFAKLAAPLRAAAFLSGLLLVLALFPANAAAEIPQPFWKSCNTGPAAGQCQIPRGIAASPSGHVYVGDQVNRRITELSAWGEFVRTWGWDVVASGPGDDTVAPEDQFEICVPADGDVCKAGIQGAGVGQISFPYGVAVDAAGNVFVVDRNNQRVQKFDSEGNFLLMFGGGVNQGPGSPGNVCTAAHVLAGDICGVGTKGSTPGEFGEWGRGNYIAITPDGKVYVGDAGRIQRFDTAGNFVEVLPDPEELLKEETVMSLAVEPTASGNLYVAFGVGAQINPEPDVLKLNSAGEELCTITIARPSAIAATTSTAYVVDDVAPVKVRQFDSSCADLEEPFGAELFNGSTGIAASQACISEGTNIYVTNADNSNSFVQAFGPIPDPFHIEEFESCKPPEVPPVIENQGALSVGIDQAALQAKINPRFWPDTSYHVQFGTAKCVNEGGWEAECVEEKPVPDALLGAGTVGVSANTAPVLLSGLVQETEYVFRFVAQSRFDAEGSEVNENGGPVFGVGGTEEADGTAASFTTRTLPPGPISDCPNDAFRRGAGSFLPDCRAYEMVSPINKNGGDIRPPRGDAYLQAAPDGERITYSAIPAFAGQPSNMLYNQYLAERVEGSVPGVLEPGEGWVNRGVNAPVSQLLTVGTIIYGGGREAGIFSESLCDEFLVDHNRKPLSPEAPQGYANLYHQDLCGSDGFAPLIEVAPLNGDPAQYVDRDSVQGFAADMSEVAFWASAELEVSADSVAPAKATTHRQIYGFQSENGGLHLVSVTPAGIAAVESSSEVGSGIEGSLDHAVSEGGKRIYWTAQISSGAGQLYLRVNPAEAQGQCSEVAKSCTLAVSAGNQATFWTARPDGVAALYSEGGTLWRFDALSGESVPVVEELVGFLGASEDLSRIYYISSKNLTVGEQNSEGDEAQEGEPNLYLDEEGERSFVATLLQGDVSSPLAYSIGARKRRLNASRVTPDGAHLAFQSRAPLTGFDNLDTSSGEHAVEVFTYEAGGELNCVSCDPGGERPRARELPEVFQHPQLTLPTGVHAAAWIPGWEHPHYASRVLSSDGGRLFFNSNTPLVARDTNGAQDVYEWETPGMGSCEESSPHYREANGGCVYLISSGKSPFESEFWDASSDGRDVFFTTEAGLLPQDPGNIDLYDARAGGGFPQPVKEKECEGEACAGASAPPQDSTPSSQTFEGPGNVIQRSDCGTAARQAAKLLKQAKRIRQTRPAAARRVTAKAKAKGRAARRCRRAVKRVSR